ncbi:calpain-B-like isoform X2 [Rhodnius prolixus]|uniref:calpain-B-like isoform X2 n=1 Tax=Rhodnius prolixus TaxID=13249 RepID=UPI003D18D354
MPYWRGNIPVYYWGERNTTGFSQNVSGIQDYNKLKEQCLSRATLFEDPEFPANDSSIFLNESNYPNPIVWKRPGEIVEDPVFNVRTFSRQDVAQEESKASSWYLSVLTLLSLNKQLLNQVIPESQSFEDDYAGIFHFRFWQYGHWVDIVVDDRLPTHQGQLIYARLSNQSRFWSLLLEKAYAKLLGAYEKLHFGLVTEALEDFTSGLVEEYTLNDKEVKVPNDLYEIMLKAQEKSSLMFCSVPWEAKELLSQGLKPGRYYCITRVHRLEVVTAARTYNLLRLFDPQGGKSEWRGEWSVYWPEWKNIPEQNKEELALFSDHDGEFWIPFEFVLANFWMLHICNLSPLPFQEFSNEDDDETLWRTIYNIEAEWVRGSTAGGSDPLSDSFCLNPQCGLQLSDPDKEDNMCTAVIALMQKFARNRKDKPENITNYLYLIGFHVYNLTEESGFLGQRFFKTKKFVANCVHNRRREVIQRLKLPPGDYVIIPSTLLPNQESKFLLRVFTENKDKVVEQDEEIETGTAKELIEATTSRQVNLDEEKANEENLRKLFKEYAGADEQMDCFELKVVLDCIMRNEINGGFSKEACRSMIALVDADRSGKLDFEEFKYLCNIIKAWKTVFESYDSLNTGYLNPFDLRPALNSAGYELSNRVINALCHRYAGRDGRIAIDDFILCAVRLESMMEIFKDKDPNNTKVATFTVEEWMENAIYS